MKHILRDGLNDLWAVARRHKFISTGMVIVLATIVGVQLFYPRDRVLPFARLDGMKVGAKSDTQLTQVLIDKY